MLAEKFSNSIKISNDMQIRIKMEICHSLLTTKPAPESGAGFAQFGTKKYLSEMEDKLSPYYWFNVKPT